MNTYSKTYTSKRPAFASLRAILADAPKLHTRHLSEEVRACLSLGTGRRSGFEHMPFWMRLEREQLEKLIAELEFGRHLLNPGTIRQLQAHLLELKRTDFGNQLMHDARTPYEDRFEEERDLEGEPSMDLPQCWTKDSTARPRMSPEVKAMLDTESNPLLRAWHYQMWRYQNRLVTLEDGRWAYRLDARRAQPLCGVLGTVWLSEAESRANEQPALGHMIWVTGSVQCSECGGMHMHPVVEVPKPATTAVSDPLPTCQHCGSTALEPIVYGQAPFQIMDVHCLKCGWYPSDTLTQMPLSVVEDNLRAEPAFTTCLTPSAFIREQLEVVDGDGSGGRIQEGGEDSEDSTDAFENGQEESRGDREDMSEENQEESTDTLSDEGADVLTDFPQHDELLVSLQRAFWKNRHVKFLRGYLLDMTVRYADLRCNHARRDLVWAVASVLAESCEQMRKAEQRQCGRWILEQSDEELRTLLPEVDLTAELTTGVHDRSVPPMDGWIRQWQLACVNKRRSFTYAKAAARKFAPYFGVYSQTFLRAVREYELQPRRGNQFVLAS